MFIISDEINNLLAIDVDRLLNYMLTENTVFGRECCLNT